MGRRWVTLLNDDCHKVATGNGTCVKTCCGERWKPLEVGIVIKWVVVWILHSLWEITSWNHFRHFHGFVRPLQVVRQHNETMRVGVNKYTTAHRGVHLAVLHPHSGALMLYTFFRTCEARATKGLVNTLKSIQPGRILVFAAPVRGRSVF